MASVFVCYLCFCFIVVMISYIGMHLVAPMTQKYFQSKSVATANTLAPTQARVQKCGAALENLEDRLDACKVGSALWPHMLGMRSGANFMHVITNRW